MVTNTDKLDKVDLLILRTLQENARLTTKELAARVNLSSTPVSSGCAVWKTAVISRNTLPCWMRKN